MIGLPKTKMMRRSAVTVVVVLRVGGEDERWVCIIAVLNTSNDRRLPKSLRDGGLNG